MTPDVQSLNADAPQTELVAARNACPDITPMHHRGERTAKSEEFDALISADSLRVSYQAE
jgi:hypothetical protein